MNLIKDYDDRQIAIKVNNINEIKELSKLLFDFMFEDVNIIYARIYHGVYENWVERGTIFRGSFNSKRTEYF